MNPSPYPPPPFKSAHVRARIVKIMLIVAAVVAGLSLVIEGLSFAFPPLTEDQEVGDNPFGAALMLITLLDSVLELIIYLTTVVCFAAWLYRAYGNLRALSPSRPINHTPTLAVGSFFIPFANLIIPYRAVKELWQKSGPPEEAIVSEPSPPVTFPIWWLFWILASIAGNIAMRASFDESVPMNNATVISMISSVLYIVAAVFAYLGVDAIDTRQEETSRLVRVGTFSVPPPPPTSLQFNFRSRSFSECRENWGKERRS
jgi:hypothetical protein